MKAPGTSDVGVKEQQEQKILLKSIEESSGVHSFSSCPGRSLKVFSLQRIKQRVPETGTAV